MFGILLIVAGTFCGEIAASIGKTEVENGKECIYTMAFLNLFWPTVLFALLIVFKHDLFVFSLASLPTFFVRAILEILQVYLVVQGLVRADRSTFSFIRLATIPLLLITDLVIGYTLNNFQILGILVLCVVLALVFLGKKINKAGAVWVILGALNAVFTLSLFKYNITNFNSVVAEQLFIQIILLIFFFFFSWYKITKNPICFLGKKVFFAQSFSEGVGGVLASFAYGLLPASVAVAAVRATALLWAVLFGKVYFEEKHIIFKFLLITISIIGLVLLAI